jgi:hypothetical protein
MNNPNDDEAPTKTGAANPSSSQASGLNATNERQSLTLEQLRKDFGGNKRQNIQGTALGPPAPPGEHKDTRREDPPTYWSQRSIQENENNPSSCEDSAEGEEWDELTNIVWQSDETKPHTSALKRGPSESTLPINNLTPLQDSSGLLHLVLQSQKQIRELQEEIALLKAQQPRKRTSFETQMSPIPLDGSIRPPQHGHPHEWDDSYLHGSDMNWSRHLSDTTNATPKAIARTVSDRSTASSRPSEKRWRPLHLALSETEQAHQEDNTTGTNGSKIAEFSRRSSLVFMHPEEGTEKEARKTRKGNA